jgi:hypothetical protein
LTRLIRADSIHGVRESRHPRLGAWFMNINKSGDIELSCEKCGTALSTDEASRTLLIDGYAHVFCQSCMQHVLIVKDGSIQF